MNISRRITLDTGVILVTGAKTVTHVTTVTNVTPSRPPPLRRLMTRSRGWVGRAIRRSVVPRVPGIHRVTS